VEILEKKLRDEEQLIPVFIIASWWLLHFTNA
jgi:hypothetical protein